MCAREAPSLVVPRAYTADEGGGGSSVLRDAIRLQNVYSSRLFPSNKVLVIRELRYRPSAIWGDAFATTIADIQINLSATRAPVGGLSATFANNVGPDDTVVFNGSIDISSGFCGPKNGPKEFDIIIPLRTPFRYNPALGNLLIDYRNRSGSRAGNIDAGVNNGASRAFSLGGDSTVAHSVDQGAEVVQLVYTEEEPDPEPPGSGLVIPPTYARREGVGGSSVLRDQIRLQNVYASRLFPSNKVLLIRELRFRPSAIHGSAFSATISSLQINLSTTRSAVDGLSETFADNVGANDTVVFNGSVNLSSAFAGPASGPKAFDIVIPLTTPFRYDPLQGNLLIDYRNRSGSGATWIDSGVNNGASRVFALGANSTVAQSVDQGAEVVQLVYTEAEPEPEPQPDGLIIPPAYATRDAVGGSSVLYHSIRLQNVYSAGLFPSNTVLTIRELRYRPSAVWGNAFATTISNIQINLSSTRAAVDGLSATFADNVGANDTVVFNGSISISSAFSGPASGPKAFDIVIPLTTPFRYNPAEGNLLIDYRNRSGSGAANIDAGVNNGASRVFALGADSTVAHSVDQGAEVVQLIYTEDQPDGRQLIIPKTAQGTEMPFGSGTFVDRALRNQQVYESSEFPEGPVLIRELRFRPDSTYGRAFSAVVSNIQINLSTTGKGLGELSSTYSQNVGADDTVVFQGPLTMSSQFTGPANGPKDFDIIVPLSRSFLYDPARGSLVVDVRNFSGSSASRVSGQTGPDRAGRVVGSLNSTAGIVDTGADAIQILYAPGTNQPPPPPPAAYDLSHDFSLPANPNGVWSYGRQETIGGAFTLFGLSQTNISDNGVPILVTLMTRNTQPAILHNDTTQTATTSGGGVYPPETTWFAPGVQGQPGNYVVARMTVPAGAGGNYRLATTVRPAFADSVQQDTDFHVLKNNLELFGAALIGGQTAGYTNTVSVSAGDTIDFVVGRGADNSYIWSQLKVEATLTPSGSTNGLAATIVSQPTNQTVLEGGSASFMVSASGTAPLSYQWRKDSTPIPGAASATLTLSNVQSSHAGNYSVSVSNAFGVATSRTVTLTVNPVIDPGTNCLPVRQGLVSWWRAEGNAQDSGGTNHGTALGATFSEGRNGQAFSFDGNDRIAVPDSDSLEITRSLSIEGWVKVRSWPNDNAFGAAMVVYRGDDRPGLDPFYIAVLNTGVLRFAINSADSQFAAVDGPLVTNRFVHFAGTLDDASGVMRLYLNGVLAAETNTALRAAGELGSSAAGLGIGNSQQGSIFRFGLDGLVDELKLYSRALTAQEVQMLYENRPCSEDSLNLVVPNVSATVDDGGGSGLLNTHLRHQIVYDASQFPSQVIRITELRMRPSARWGNAFTSTIPNLQINLSTTGVEANAMNADFAQNVGSNEVVAFQGPLTVSSRFVGPANGPKEFDIVIPLTTPFVYDPSRGNLLIDVRNFSGSSAAFVDIGQRTDDGSSRAFALSVNATTAATRDPGAEVVRIVFSTVSPTAHLTPIALVPSGGFAFTFDAAGGNYVVETSTDLVNWAVLKNVAGVTGLVEVLDPQASTRQRFYRARLAP